MKKLLGILVLGLLLGALASCDYLDKRKKCQQRADRMDTVALGKRLYKNCMEGTGVFD